MKNFIALGCSLFLLGITLLGMATQAWAAPKENSLKRVWSAEEIIAERQHLVKPRKKLKYCSGSRFKPCVCPSNVTKAVQYRPAVRECGGKAAIILSGDYLTAFSAVVRDTENRDRWPAQGANGCSSFERDVLGLNKCSVFKVQKILDIENEDGDAEIHCLGASGYSPLFRDVSRITIKLRDVVGSNQDPLVRLCLAGNEQPLN